MIFTWSLANLFWVSSRRQRLKMCWWETGHVQPDWPLMKAIQTKLMTENSVQKLNVDMRVRDPSILLSHKRHIMIIQDLFKEKGKKEKKKGKKTIIHSPLLYSLEYKLWYVQMIVKGIGYTSPISTEDHVTVKLVFVCHSQNMIIIVTCIWVYNSHFTGQLLFRTGCVRDAEITRPALPELQFFKYIFI